MAKADEERPGAVTVKAGLNNQEKPVGEMGLGGTFDLDGAHAGGPREGVKGGVWFSLIDKVFRPRTLYAAWVTVKRNGGSAGGPPEHKGL